MNPKITTLDVRAEFRAGQHPCDAIKSALDRVGREETLRLLVPFEPMPLFDLAGKKGLGHQSTQTPEGDWEVLFSHDPAAAAAAQQNPAPAAACNCSSSPVTEWVDLDARGLVPPQPMMRILEALPNLPGQAGLRAHTDRRPVHLYPFLLERGFEGDSEEQSDGSFITHIRR